MEETITNQENVKTCVRCSYSGDESLFILKRSICRKCESIYVAEKRKEYLRYVKNAPETDIKKCSHCESEKHVSNYIYNCSKCDECRNMQRKEKYWTDEQHNKKVKASGVEYKKKKAVKREAQREEERKEFVEKHGEGNAICKYCECVKPISRFRHNRRKCRECERDEPISRILRSARARIRIAIVEKTHHLVEYLGCNGRQYCEWLEYSNSEYVKGDTNWHIDHVIPVSKFDIENADEQLIAFNWRNTMPLTAQENMSKNNKILPEQIKSHIEKLEKFHEENNIEFPNEFRALFAKHLDDGKPLKPSLPLTPGNLCEEHD